MNWKFTKVKTIVSVVVSGVFGLSAIIYLSLISKKGLICSSGAGQFPTGLCVSVYKYLPYIFILTLIGFGLTYLIWSLIQKKEIVEIQKKGTDDNIKEAQQ